MAIRIIEKFAVVVRCYHVQSVCAPKNENVESVPGKHDGYISGSGQTNWQGGENNGLFEQPAGSYEMVWTSGCPALPHLQNILLTIHFQSGKLHCQILLFRFRLDLPVETYIEQSVEDLLELRPRLQSHGLQISTGQNRLHVLIGREECRDLPLHCISFALGHEEQQRLIG